jgi:hypothetical protein
MGVAVFKWCHIKVALPIFLRSSLAASLEALHPCRPSAGITLRHGLQPVAAIYPSLLLELASARLLDQGIHPDQP